MLIPMSDRKFKFLTKRSFFLISITSCTLEHFSREVSQSMMFIGFTFKNVCLVSRWEVSELILPTVKQDFCKIIDVWSLLGS